MSEKVTLFEHRPLTCTRINDCVALFIFMQMTLYLLYIDRVFPSSPFIRTLTLVAVLLVSVYESVIEVIMS
jgi:hypothetical protein